MFGISRDENDSREAAVVEENPLQNIRKHVKESGCMCQLII